MGRLKEQQGGVLLRVIPIALGFLGLLLALVLAMISGRFLQYHLILAGVSLLSVVGGVLWLQGSRLRESVYTLVYTVFVVLCCMVLYLISANRTWRIDLTKDRIHSLSPLTESLLRQLPANEQVILQIFAPRAQHDAIDSYLRIWRELAPQVRFQVFDARGDLDAVAQIGETLAQNGRALLNRVDASGELVRRVDGQFFVTSELRENQLTNLFARGIGNVDQTAYYLMGFGERRLDDSDLSLSTAMRLFAESVMPLQPLRFAEGRIPSDAGMLIVASPANDLTDFEFDLLINYLNQGGKLLMMIDPIFQDRTLIPNFERLLDEFFGLPSPNRIVVDPLAMMSTRIAYTPQAIFARHPITNATRGTPFRMEFARPLMGSDEGRPGMNLDALLVTHNDVWSESAVKPRSTRTLTRPADESEIGRLFLAVAASRPTPGARFGQEMRAVIIGDSVAFSNPRIENNGDAAAFLLQSGNWLREQDDLLQIPPKILTSTPITLDATRAWTLLGGYLLIGLLITFGGTGWVIYRRKTR